MFQGTLDETVPLSASDELVTDLQTAGTNVEMVIIDGATHIDACFGILGHEQLGNPLCFAWLEDILGE